MRKSINPRTTFILKIRVAEIAYTTKTGSWKMQGLEDIRD